MKYYKRLKVYKSNKGNCTFNPETFDAHSYKWWRFVAKIDGKVIFNNYNYSPTTTKHQWKLRSLLRSLDIQIDIEAPFERGIPDLGLDDIILMSEENLCDEFLRFEESKIRKNERAKVLRARKKEQSLMVKSEPKREPASQVYFGNNVIQLFGRV